MAETKSGFSPVKIGAVIVLLLVNALLLGLIVSKGFGSVSDAGADQNDSGGNEASSSDVDGADDGEVAVVDGGGEGGQTAWSIDAALNSETTCERQATGEPIRIGYAADYGSSGASADIPAVEAATHLASKISCAGGVGGRPVEVEVVEVAGGYDAVQTMADSGVIAIIGPPFQGSAISLLEVVDGQVPIVFATSTESDLEDAEGLSFMVTFDYQQGAAAAASFARKNEWNRAAIFIGQENDYFSLNPLIFASNFEGNGGEIIGRYVYLPGETIDFEPAIDQFADDPPDVIYSAMLASQVAQFRAQLAARGLNIEFIGSDSLEASGAYFTPGLDGVYHTTHIFPQAGDRVDRLNQSIAASTGAGSSSPTFAALAGDAMAVILDAHARAGTDDPKSVGAAIAASVGVQGVTGVLSYDGAGSPKRSVYIHQVVAGLPTLAEEVPG